MSGPGALLPVAEKYAADGSPGIADGPLSADLDYFANGNGNGPHIPPEAVAKLPKDHITNARANERRRHRANCSQEAKTAAGLPTIETNSRHLRDVSTEALAALIAANDPDPAVFVRTGRLVRVDTDEKGRPSIRDLGMAGLRARLARCANFVSTSDKRGVVPVAPSNTIVEDVQELTPWTGIVALEGIVTAPVVAPDGTLEQTPGYLPAARVFYHEADPRPLADVAPTPTAVAAAKYQLLDMLLADFPFATDGAENKYSASCAHALSLLLLPFVRPYINGPTPLHLIDAPTPGTGKSLLAEAAVTVFTGRDVPATPPAGTNEDEWRKRITSALLGGSPFVWLDNINRRLDSGQLSLALTAREWRDRLMGGNTEVTLPVRCVWIGTANNADLSDEITRRTVWIRMDANQERPEDRDPSAFRVPHLKAWITERRPVLLAAVLTLLRAWIAAGRPAWSGRPLGSYEAWSVTMGGILESVGVPGFLENRAEMYQRSDPEREKWAAFLREWHEKHGAEPVGTGDVIDLAGECELIAVDPGKERAARNTFGRMLRAKADRVFSGYRLTSAGTKDRAARYRVIRIPENDKSNESNESNESLHTKREEVSKNQKVDTPMYTTGDDSSDSFDSFEPPLDTSHFADPFASDEADDPADADVPGEEADEPEGREL